MVRSLPQLSEDVIRLNPELCKELRGETPSSTVPTDHRAKEEKAFRSQEEKALQVQCENWLTLRGYFRRSPGWIERAKDATGWFVHVYKAKKNPILLDLLVLNKTCSRCIEIELKTLTGKPTTEQASLIEFAGGHLVRSFEEFSELILSWEKSNNNL